MMSRKTTISVLCFATLLAHRVITPIIGLHVYNAVQTVMKKLGSNSQVLPLLNSHSVVELEISIFATSIAS